MIFCIGANYGGTDLSLEFIKQQGIFIGYKQEDAKFGFAMLKSIPIGGLVAIKSYSPKTGLYIKAIGLCKSSRIISDQKLGDGREIKLLWSGNEHIGIINDHAANMRFGSIYQEYNPDVISIILNLF